MKQIRAEEAYPYIKLPFNPETEAIYNQLQASYQAAFTKGYEQGQKDLVEDVNQSKDPLQRNCIIWNGNEQRFRESWWYLREFDFFPEQLVFYKPKLCMEAKKEIQSQKHWRLYTSLEEARKASNIVRKAVGLPEYDFKKGI